MTKNSHCSYCGHKFTEAAWPRTCANCKNISFINPLPVVALVVPVGDGVLTVRRGEEPGMGQLALPGGYLDVGETWQAGAARELKEETGVIVDPRSIWLRSVETSLRHNSLLIFCTAPAVEDYLKNFQPNHEVLELVVVSEPQELAFPTHTEVLKEYLSCLKIAKEYEHLTE